MPLDRRGPSFAVGLSALRRKLEYYQSRGRQMFDPAGCLWCTKPAQLALCPACEAMLARLKGRDMPVAQPPLPDVPREECREWTIDDL